MLTRGATRGVQSGPIPRPVSLASRAALALASALDRDRRRIRQLTVVAHTQLATRHGVLEPVNRLMLESPRHWANDGVDRMAVEAPGVKWSMLADVEMNDTSLVRSRRSLVGSTDVDRSIEQGLRIKGPGFVAHAGDQVLVETSRPRGGYERVIRLCGFGSGNWYHWLIEILPPATALDRLPSDIRDLPLLVPEAVAHRATWRDALEAVVGDRPVVFAPREGLVKAKAVVCLDPAVSGPRTLRAGTSPRLGMLLPSLGLIERLRKHVLERFGIKPRSVPMRRVLLVRPVGSTRPSNQESLVQIAAKLGFEPVDPGALSFLDQVKLFAEAECVAGAWGAAWSSMIFASPEARGLMWAPEAFRMWTLYSHLAPVSGMQLRNLYVPTDGSSFKDANNARQHVPIDEFSAALASLV